MDHCQFFETLDELISHLGVGYVVLTKLALLTKLKQDGSAKHRLIWDLLRSDVNSTVSLAEWLVLPRRDNSVEGRKHLHRVHGAVEWLVVTHAFRSTPIRPSERQVVCRKVGTRFLLFNILVMGKSHPMSGACLRPPLDAWFHRS